VDAAGRRGRGAHDHGVTIGAQRVLASAARTTAV
jgi:hypothetical protein